MSACNDDAKDRDPDAKDDDDDEMCTKGSSGNVISSTPAPLSEPGELT